MNKYLEKIASVMALTPNLDHDLIKNKPLTEPMKNTGLKPKKPPMITAKIDKV